MKEKSKNLLISGLVTIVIILIATFTISLFNQPKQEQNAKEIVQDLKSAGLDLSGKNNHVDFEVIAEHHVKAAQPVYEYQDFKVKIVVPENWKEISPKLAGQLGSDVKNDKLYLGFFDPKTGIQKGVFVFTAWDRLTPEKRNLIETQLKTHNKIQWKEHQCFFVELDLAESNGLNYCIFQNKQALSFIVSYAKGYQKPVTKILDGIEFDD